MKVLFVGEGTTDIGGDEGDALQPHPAGGVVPTLARRVEPVIGANSVALKWTALARLNRDAKKRGYEAKIRAALVLAERKYDCAGTICVVDRDGEKDRLTRLEAARQAGLKMVKSTHRAAVGVAVESVEAWTLGAPSALIAVLGVATKDIAGIYNANRVEELHEQSGKPERHPKTILALVAALKYRSADVGFREEIAAATDLDELAKHCKQGFEPFAAALRTIFGGSPS